MSNDQNTPIAHIKIARKFFEHPFWREKRKFSRAEAWIDILRRTNFSDKPRIELVRGRQVVINYGECFMTTRYCGLKWGWHNSAVHRFIKLLEYMEQITVKIEHQMMVLTVLNYEKYHKGWNGDTNSDGTVTEQWRNSDGTILKNVKKIKKIKNVNIPIGISSSAEQPDDPPLPKPTSCPHQKIIELYHEVLPELNRIQVWDKTSERNLQARWREAPERQELEWWRQFFEHIKTSDFLMGRVKEFRADLMWIVGPKNFAKIINGKYKNTRSVNGQQYKNIKACQEFIEDESIR